MKKSRINNCPPLKKWDVINAFGRPAIKQRCIDNARKFDEIWIYNIQESDMERFYFRNGLLVGWNKS